jgi:hypothetical protein|tara:strand:+ start:195 stop:392 length:198 start_codon:yes stop_codon:yes gene_type:complete
MPRKTANDVDTSLKIHEKMCEERWRSIFRKTDSLQSSVDSMKIWLLGGLTTIIASLVTLIVKTAM